MNVTATFDNQNIKSGNQNDQTPERYKQEKAPISYEKIAEINQRLKEEL